MARMLHNETPGAAEGEQSAEAEGVLETEAPEGQQTNEKAPPRHFDASGAPLTRLQIKEACKLAYCSRKARMTDLSAQYAIPYDTLTRWANEERWSDTRNALSEETGQKAANLMAEWLAEERLGQIRRALGRGQRLQSALDVLYADGNCMVKEDGTTVRVPLCAKDLQGIAVAEERADLIIRRNLGMDEQQGAGRINVNINALGDVQLGQ